MRINLGAVGDTSGLTLAQCPSTEMLKGIVDINDPCQSGSLPPSVTDVENAALNTYSLPQGQINSLPLTPGSSISMNTIYLAGAALLGIMLFVGGRRR